jgi:nicotinate dehydrogenase subunit B
MSDIGQGRLLIFRQGAAGRETSLRIDADGRVTGFHGHVDLGTGLRTAITQIIAEELDVPPAQVRVVMGDTRTTPDQGPTIASESIQVAAVPMRQAAAQARAIVLARAAELLQCQVADLSIEAGRISQADAARAPIPLGEIVASQMLEAELDPTVAVKPVGAYRIVGRSLPRVDIPAKTTGDFTFVHDVRLPGMLHGHVVRPPYAGRDSGDFIGRSLIAIDREGVAGMPGFVAVVVAGDFVGVVAEREEQAQAIAEALPVRWRMPPALPDMGDVAEAIRSHPSTRRELLDRGDVARALLGGRKRLRRRYTWPWQMHGSIGPSCAVADWRDGALTVWAGTQNPHMLRGDLSQLMRMPEAAIEIRRYEAAGCYGRNCADDVCGDAALLSRAVGRPVRVQLTREQEHLWEPKGAGQLMEIEGAIDAEGDFHAYDFNSWYPSNRGPNLALLLTGIVDPSLRPSDMGDRTAIPPYDVPHMRIAVHDMAPIVRASWMRGVSAMPNTFAHESFIDELAAEAGEDPVAYRLRHLRDDPRAADLIRRTAAHGGWAGRTAPRLIRDGTIAYGQGFAYATYVHGTFPGVAAAKAAWIAEVAVDCGSGEVTLSRVVVGQDSGLMINPEGVRHQIEGNVMQSASRVLTEAVTFDSISVTSRDWGGYPIMKFPEAPQVDTLMVLREDEPPLGVGESASVPSAAAIANAIFDATGVRMRDLPFTPERVKAALAGQPLPRLSPPPRAPAEPPRWRAWAAAAGAALVSGLTTAAVGWSLHREIPRAAPLAPGTFSAETIERGRQLFALGDCAVCHTSEGGAANAGGRPIETPFGTVHSTNLTPDIETGMGGWTYEAFARAMRQGIGRDGRHLYPAFPYTAYARMSEADLQALYAYLQTLEPVRQETPAARMVFPASLRAGMAAWNLAFHDAAEYRPDPVRSAEWNRGAYLVTGIGHCGACHTPRNVAGAERAGAFLAGGMVDGWEAPALDGSGRAPLRWTEDDFYDYLRTGLSVRHGAAAGPMAPVVEQLAAAPDADIRAMAVYLASLAPGAADAAPHAEVERRALDALAAGTGPAARLFDTACGSCHLPGPIATATGARVPLAFASSVHADTPDGFLRVLLDGLQASPSLELNDMPGFARTFDDRQIIDLAAYLRRALAPDKAPWEDLADALSRARRRVSRH